MSAYLGYTAKLGIRGTNSGEMHVVTVVPIRHNGSWYVCGLNGEENWVRNMRADGTAKFTWKGRNVGVNAVEVDGEERSSVQAEYRRSTGFPQRDFERLPMPEDHPTFRLETIET